ncbi:molybdopterin-dependent oxidoreductase [Curtobacterium flaccumfaciens]|uniref:molybdopterin-dependent oxidoreductase n=1 Tax=Curtobacterium flaccumfaciens TaxID=2035 RepID=UPI001BDEFE84|nr:molybdopterin-dependent oxidoreductase [Curtobacterium flaccumfaciens]MBT1606749.1 molybdopterin-dependent oxidoreductase [Curtobacterium flaccumfaciens pv. betae]MBT1657569.1 molybdopterin-dependent oxidoreductase [Curtobacterium flaccumfaciens pv. betae]MCS0471887.1 molybdopterin-dependent oxidoreductase [Curtobacterium flaccumfaciens pv. betae]MCS0474754.1 molybdopterin-dependent oxidoreductase [Curtobacterium flaccumfaciens pv. betae]MCS0478300.1 molybdopterin-dependent oxidoreductase [
MRDADGDDARQGEYSHDGQHRADPDGGAVGQGRSEGTQSVAHGPSRLSGLQRLLHDGRAALASPNRNARSAVVLGRLLGIAFLICFGTGIYSHLLQEPLGWMRFPTRPTQLYQFTQGLHITTGIAIIPLLLAKLNTVMPALVQVPPVRGVLHLLERLSIAVLVSASIIQVVTGLLNTYQWYPWPFPFRQVHNALAYVIIGSLAIHIAAKLPVIARYWRKRDSYDAHGRFIADPASGSELLPPGLEAHPASAPHAAGAETARPTAPGLLGRVFRWIDGVDDAPAPAGVESRPSGPDTAPETREVSEEPSPGQPTADVGEPSRASRPTPDAATGRRQRIARRGFFAGVTAATVGVVALTAGQSSKLAEPFNVFGARGRGIGANGLPVNRTARAAGVLASATAADWTLTVVGHDVSRTFVRAELVALGTAQVDLPISCVEGWSQMATWKGVRMRDLLDAVQAPQGSHVRVTSLERHGGYRIMDMGPEYAEDPTTLIALELNGATLDLDHGFPARIIAPGRPGVLQTKWIEKIEVLR